MTDQKITDLTALTGANLETGDQFVMVDVSDTTMDASGTDKKMAAAELAAGIALQGVGGGDYFRSGYYSLGMFSSVGWGSTTGGSVGRLHLRSFLVPVRRTFDRIGVNVSTAATAASGSLARFGIYSGAGMPTTLILDAGTVSVESTGAKEVTISQTLDPGVYWVGLATQVSTAGGVAYSAMGQQTAVPWYSSSTSPPFANNGYGAAWFASGATGSLPSTITPTANDFANVIGVCLRAA